MQKSLPVLLLQYLHSHYPKSGGYTLNEIYNIQEEAREYYLKSLPPGFKIRERKILKANGFTPKSWKKVLDQSLQFWFSPSNEQEKCNKELKELCKNYEIINRTAGLRNYLSCILKNACDLKNPKILRVNTKPFRYTLLKP